MLKKNFTNFIYNIKYEILLVLIFLVSYMLYIFFINIFAFFYELFNDLGHSQSTIKT